MCHRTKGLLITVTLLIKVSITRPISTQIETTSGNEKMKINLVLIIITLLKFTDATNANRFTFSEFLSSELISSIIYEIFMTLA